MHTDVEIHNLARKKKKKKEKKVRTRTFRRRRIQRVRWQTMHGRLKVRTTQEQQERKRLEREKKLQVYRAAMGECLRRNGSCQFDARGLKVTEVCLSFKRQLASNIDI